MTRIVGLPNPRCRHASTSRVGILLCMVLLACAVLSTVRAAEPQRITPVERVTNSVIVRSDPTTDGSVPLGRLRPGQSASVLESLPGWYHVRTDTGQDGFVSKRWVRAADGPGVMATGVPFRLHVVDVGTGDAMILDMGEVEILFDGGLDATPLREYAKANDIIQWPVELAVVTHADSDHWKGLEALLATPAARALSRPVTEFWEPGFSRSCSPLPTYDEFISHMRSTVTAARFLRPLRATHAPAVETGRLEPFTVAGIPGVRFTLLHADPEPPSTGDCAYQINDASVVMLLEVGGVRLLLTGDANGKERDDEGTVAPSHVEARLLALTQSLPQALKADVLKVPHHGSETASTERFINAVKPQYALISASTRHHLPKPAVIRRYEDADAIILRTDRTRQAKNDPILCIGNGTGDVECNFADELE